VRSCQGRRLPTISASQSLAPRWRPDLAAVAVPQLTSAETWIPPRRALPTAPCMFIRSSDFSQPLTLTQLERSAVQLPIGSPTTKR
jgi:hypothetical protein